jgi:hypothetical protein
LAASGQLHPDTDPTGYADSIKQWAIWSRLEHWTPSDLERNFVDRMRKNVEALGQKWNKNLETQVRQLLPNRMRDIAAVQAAADAKGPGVP